MLGLICPTRQEQTSSSAHSPLSSVPGGWAPVLPCFRPHEARSASTLPVHHLSPTGPWQVLLPGGFAGAQRP